MRIEIFPEQLAHQLPEIRNDIIQTYTKKLVIEGKEYGGPEEKRMDVLKRFPEYADLFTKMQLNFLSLLMATPNRVVARSDFSNQFKSTASNIVDVHMKVLRQRIKKNRLDIEIRTIRGVGFKLVV